MTKLIINADDFGLSRLINRMIIELAEENAITSVSVIVDNTDPIHDEEPIKKLIQLSDTKIIGIGLHIYFKNTNFQKEIQRQYQKFIEIFDFKPSHIDIHKPDYLKNGYKVIQEFCKERGIACKNLSVFGEDIMTKEGLITTKNSAFLGTKKTFSEIKSWLVNLQEGYYDINFHPGYYDPELESSLNKERVVDAKHIRMIQSIIKQSGIELVTYKDLTNSIKN